jgi:hypothetical protein
MALYVRSTCFAFQLSKPSSDDSWDVVVDMMRRYRLASNMSGWIPSFCNVIFLSLMVIGLQRHNAHDVSACFACIFAHTWSHIMLAFEGILVSCRVTKLSAKISLQSVTMATPGSTLLSYLPETSYPY